MQYINSLNENLKKISDLENINNEILKKLDSEREILNNKILFIENELKNSQDKLKQANDKIIKLEKENKDLSEQCENSKMVIDQFLSGRNNIDNPNNHFVPLIGLNNIGATCFMNSTLQCLSQTKDLTNYFLDKKNEKNIKENNIHKQNPNDLQLSPIYLELVQKLWEKNGPKSYSPNNFMNMVEMMNPLFKQGQAGDSKDFIIFILEQLHKELKKSVKHNNMNNINVNQPLNQYDKKNAFSHFFGAFQEECSIISDIFFGISESTNECLNCKNFYNLQHQNNPICYNYQIFNCLIFPLEEVKNMKNKQNNFIMNQNNVVTLYECFNYYQRKELFTGQNQNYCNLCHKLSDAIYTSKIFSSPNVLVLILNRGKGNIYDVKLLFNEKIDISPFVLSKDKNGQIYELYGVITHIGKSGPNAHFVASCRNVDNKWYRFNDAIVSPITNLQKEVIEFGTPYILFYKKKYLNI